MAKSGLLDRIDSSNRVTIHHEEDGKHFVESRQDVTHILAAAKIIADQPPGKDFRHVAFVPETVLNASFTEGWFDDPKAWKRWLNDPDNRDFRTGGGRV